MLIWACNDSSSALEWHYSYLEVRGSDENYRIRPSGSNGNARYAPLSDQSFSTFDRDNYFDGVNCAYVRQSGWWHPRSCLLSSNLNGRHQPSGAPGVRALEERLVWRTDFSEYTVFTNSEIKIRPKNC